MFTPSFTLKQLMNNHLGLLQNQEIVWLYESLYQQKILSKNIVILSYDNPANFQAFMDSYYSKKLNHQIDFGIIRESLSIDIKQSLNLRKDKAFLQIYGQGGLHSDVDFFQSLKQLLQSLHIQWAPCQNIHKDSFYKYFRKNIQKGMSYLSLLSVEKRENSNLLLDSILCQLEKSLFTHSNEFNNSKPHVRLMERGFQSVFVEFILPSSSQNNLPSFQSKRKVSKFLYSFLNQFLAQQDHLHSSTTLFYPINNSNFVPITGTIYGGIIILIVGLIKIIGQIVQDHKKLSLSIKKETFLFAWILGWQYFLVQNINISIFVMILLKSIFAQIKAKDQDKVLCEKNKAVDKNRFWHLILAGIQFLFAIYLCVFNYSLFYLSVLLAIIILYVSRTRMIIGVLILLAAIVYWKSDYNRFSFGSNLQNLFIILQTCLFSFIQISTQVKLIMLPFIVWLLD